MSPTLTTRERSATERSPAGILLIGLFKLLKGVLLVAVGIGALKLLHKNMADVITQWTGILRVDPENRFIHPLLAKILPVTPKQLKELSVGTFFYAALLLTEGIGLLMRKHWAEYFTVISTAALIPLEIHELARRVTPAKIAVIVINVIIVLYLAARLRGYRRRPQGSRYR
ncbi:MAG: DUF2127 domain-containing protein [Acidobacteriaceae bacterium]|nr:DUF2127 domain-containing protein [Acidobacteriaceae bacterium]MBV9780855.1 DUF2127 domain-containing protein [Acidobacteriaceae bacterium]